MSDRMSATDASLPSTGAAPPPSHAAAAPLDWPALHRAACAPYRAAGRFAWHFARGKLGRDPVFRHLASRGLLEHRAEPGAGPVRVLDLGCGQGLLASLLAALDAGAGPAAGVPAAPAAAGPSSASAGGKWRYTGIDLMPRDVERARAALGALALAPEFVCADMREAAFPASDVAVVLDVLHYVDHDAQRRVLERLRDALAPAGRLLLRVGDMASRPGYAASQWVDRAVTRVRGHAAPPTWGRSLAEWQALLAELGFAAEATPMSHGTPFANVLLVADLGAAPVAADGAAQTADGGPASASADDPAPAFTASGPAPAAAGG